MKKVKVIGIKWDADNLEDVEHLPTVMILDVPSHVEDKDDLEAFIEDELSNQAGFTHDGWEEHELVIEDSSKLNLSIEQWESKYKPIANPNAEDECSADRFETYGEDLDYVLNIENTTPKRVWTLEDIDGQLIICAGYHLVNRINYFVTEVEWEDKDTQVQYCDEDIEANITLEITGLPQLSAIKDNFLTFVGEWMNGKECRTGENRANGTVTYLMDGLYLYEFKTREDAAKYLFVDDRSIPYAFAEYDEDESEEKGEETFGGWEFNNEFNPIWLNAELEEFMQKNILSDEEKDALVAEIYSWHESCEQGQEGECKIFDAIEQGASDDEVILIAFDVDRDLFDKFEKPTPRYCIVQNTKEEGSSTLEDYDNLESAMEAYGYIKENGCHKSEENDGEIISLEGGTEISMDIEWWDLSCNCLVLTEGIDVPVITIQ